MVPRMTACAPSQSTKTIAPNTSKMAMMVSTERARIRARAVLNACSTDFLKRCPSATSCVKACTVGMALRISPAKAEASATRSCESRDSLRTRRPKNTIGSTTKASITIIIRDNFGLVMNNMIRPPLQIKKLRSAIEILVPIKVWMRVVSVVKRDWISPLRLVSKNSGLCVTTWA